MIKLISKGLSYLLHPLFMPLLAIILLLNIQTVPFSFTELSLSRLTNDYKYYFYGLFLLLTVLAPGFSVLIMYWSRLINSLHMETKKERFFPLLFICIYYGTIYYKIRMDIDYIPYLLPFSFGILLSSIVAFILNFYIKISIHAMGAFGLIGVLTAYFQNQMEFPILLLMGLILLGGVISSSRLYLNAHSLKEVVYGMIFGFGIEYFCVSQQWYI